MKRPDITIDGSRYLHAGNGERMPLPFNLRWLLPRLLGTNVTAWTITTRTSLFALIPATAWYVGGWPGIAAGLMVVGLPGVWRFNWKFPVLVDAPAMLCALVAADLWRHGYHWPALVLAVLAGCVRETSPVFAALYAWNPLLLVGMCAPAIRSLWKAGDDVDDATPTARFALDHPLIVSWRTHKAMSHGVWVLPWGVAVIGLADWSAQLGAVLAVAYAQCAVATDTTRLFQWSFPVMLLAAVHAVPSSWLPVLVVVGVCNPFSGSGA